MIASPHRFRDLPYFQFDERLSAQGTADVMDGDGWHVVILETPASVVNIETR
jgi:hypothetical protein